MPSPSMKKRILLILCGRDQRYFDRWESVNDAGEIVYLAPMAPLACATIAGLTPDHYEVEIWDEELRGQIRASTPLGKYDIIGVSLMFSASAYQARFLSLHLRQEGTVMVAGGPGISSAPEEFRPYFDAIFVNEAERTWPQFLRDYEQGAIKPEYRQIEKPGLEESPPPRWCNVAANVPEYEWAMVQTTRGCPFDCQFCDVIYLYGRRQRHKPVGQVIGEIRTLEALGARGIFFADDEFVGNPDYAKSVLAELIPANNSFARPLRFFTQATMNLSRDAELLALMADANFYTFVLGIESFNHDSLLETHKRQNVRKDIIGDIQKIHSYGLGPRGSFIVGFDHDGPGAFDALYDGIQRACLPWIAVSPLYAVENTPLWMRLRSEGRIAYLRRRMTGEPTLATLNIIPKQMSRVELLEGYHSLVMRLNDWSAACARLQGWVAMVQRPPQVREPLLSPAACDRFLEEATRSWGVSAAERSLIGDTLSETLRSAPHLINRVVFFLVRNHLQRKGYERSLGIFGTILEAERRGELVFDQQPLLMPPGFGPALTAFFPVLYARLYRSLPDKGMIPDAAREVLVDFVVRWGETFQALESHHEAFLLELCDRAAAKRGSRSEPGSDEEERSLVAQARKGRLLEAILKDVRDELSRTAHA
ncbi:radical SAM protein [Hyalangium sp.]|uniref:B12-binding domain-containing radical SAM protein n=1 Tax=Hyalangium sp. TaxID=2028555 RepID=UPI002D2E74D1|nr:radical SAM protein [Hyalangium sp.]HYH95732.1 radical SAM protein [Hyalangium sp.]